uniref:Murein DD-endopeptidase MepM and murein hydrolase activator NlpD, contain LysM domain n=1 Tax=Candidatus Kentrum sp. FM TaxID=2126340 RepID=A0A450S6R8_9GAMM|nr:MAG: Murein DD-endopeptidase MepM and murein hydrolase activator NlpD, contain LysM domain [Candidatus Kentron sp. FM]VFJ48731.1 MAG: Murein DD-endopeptidase MepM and murein hydrolase activator NlpD, contain LysM domain [Candidatus Kentron sp. FM]VFK07596.1 MAG: Murein DD-endopeptidase MepM and murein hydrolase activator NlpD, contain LysM domain [Candidatus Kentron sp. FM]
MRKVPNTNIASRVFAYITLAYWVASSIVAWRPALAEELALTGSLIQGGLVRGHTDPAARVVFKGREVRVSPDGLFLIGFNRDESSTASLIITLPNGHRKTETLSIEQREYDIQRIDGLSPGKVSPTKQNLARIRAEAALVRKARTRDEARTDFEGGFIRPVEGRISGVYGSQRILNGQARRPHFGIDIAAPAGTPVRAPASGVVTLVHSDMFFSGGTLILDHGHGLSSSFLHLQQILVAEGDDIRQGDVIAHVGATGRVTGAHLDWRVNLFKTRLDPALLVGFD